MTDVNCSAAKTVDGTNVETSTDGSDVTTGLETAFSDDDFITVPTGGKVGKAPDDISRIDFAEDPTLLAVGDEVIITNVGFHNVTDVALYPYDSATGVSATNKIVITSAGGTNTFVLTQAFIDDLFTQSGGGFAVRYHEDAWDISTNPGDIKMTEVQAHLTITGAALPHPSIINSSAMIALGTTIIAGLTTLKSWLFG